MINNGDPGANEATVGVASGPLGAPIVARVVGMLSARADCPIDRLDDALLVADAIAAKAGAFAPDGRINVRVVAQSGSVEMFVGPLLGGGAHDLIASASLPGVGNVLERVADELEPRTNAEAGGGDGEYLRIRLDFDALSPNRFDRMDPDGT